MSDAPNAGETQLNIQDVLAAYQRRLSTLEQDNIIKEVTITTLQREKTELQQVVANYAAAQNAPAPVADLTPTAPVSAPVSAPEPASDTPIYEDTVATESAPEPAQENTTTGE